MRIAMFLAVALFASGLSDNATAGEWGSLETKTERLHFLEQIRATLKIDRIDKAIPALSPDEQKWLNAEMKESFSPRWRAAILSNEYKKGQARRYVNPHCPDDRVI